MNALTLSIHAFKRFPSLCLCFYGWCGCAILTVLSQPAALNLPYIYINHDTLVRVIGHSGLIGASLFLLAHVLSTYTSLTWNRTGITLGCWILLLVYTLYTVVICNPSLDFHYLNQLFLSICACLLLGSTVLPFLSSPVRRFWAFINIMVIKCIRSLFFSGTVFALCVSMLTSWSMIHTQPIGIWVYQLLYYLTVCILGANHLLLAIPKRVESLDIHRPFPSFYYALCNVYLLPVCTTGLLLYTGYLFFCAYHRTLPALASLIPFTVVVYLSLFLIVQLELMKIKHKLASLFLSFFYALLLPLSMASLTRTGWHIWTNELTEFWYLLCLFFVWTTGICLYFILSKHRDIRVIPLSLTLSLLILTLTPARPYTLAITSHARAIITLLADQDCLTNAQIDPNKTRHLSKQHKKELRRFVYFLAKRNALSLLSPNLSSADRQQPYTIDLFLTRLHCRYVL